MKFKDVAHLYKGVMMKTELGIFPLVGYHKGDWWLDTIHYGAKAVEQDIKPILRNVSDITVEENLAHRNIVQTTESPLAVVHDALMTHFLLSKNFDLFGLIESGEAIDAETLTPNPYRT